jgi:hypothetical protein
VGAARSGTTSLYEYLGSVPGVYIAPIKEPHYFAPSISEDNRVAKFVTHDTSQYLSLYQGVKNESAIGEASASYLWDVESPKAIHDVVPDARIIIILRDPIERAFSHYLMSVHQRQETLPFYDAMQNDYRRSDKGYFASHLYVDLGLYSEQVKRHLDTFGPEHVKILMFEDFIKDTQAAVNDVLQFLGLKAYVPSNIGAVYDPYVNPTKRTRMISRLSKIAFGSRTAHMARDVLKTARRSKANDSLSAKDIRIQKLLQPTYKSSAPEDGRLYLQDIYWADVLKLKSILGRASVPWHNFME